MKGKSVDWKAWESTTYNSATASDYRDRFPARASHDALWYKDDPRRRQRNREYVARHRYIKKLDLKELLIDVGASPEAARRFLKDLNFQQLDRIAVFLASRDETGPLPPGVLLKLLRQNDQPKHESRESNGKVNAPTLDAIPLSP